MLRLRFRFNRAAHRHSATSSVPTLPCGVSSHYLKSPVVAPMRMITASVCAISGAFTQFDTKRFITSTATSIDFGKHAAYELSEENVMPELSRRQKAIIANFLQVSRKNFDRIRPATPVFPG